MAKRSFKMLIDNEKRIISKEPMNPGKTSCNGKLKSRDGYCQSPGIVAFERCKNHKGPTSIMATDLFQKAVGLDQAAKLQTLIEDTLSMDNELASGKTMLLQVLEDFRRASHILDEYLESTPMRPHPDASEAEIESYNSAVQLHMDIMARAQKLKNDSFKQAHSLIRTLSTGVHRNSKIKEGSKFQMDAKQVASILKLQLDVMRKNCAKCPNLKQVFRELKEGVDIIPIKGSLSESNKKAMGAKAYKDAMEDVNNIASTYSTHPIDADVEVLD